MSTVALNAYRCPVASLATVFLPAFRSHCLSAIVERLGTLAKQVKLDVVRKRYAEEAEAHAKTVASGNWIKPEYISSFDKYNKARGKYCRLRHVMESCMEASRSAARDPFCCVDCCVNVWIEKGNAHMLANGEEWIFAGFQLPDTVVSYDYWNNCDQPEDVPKREWTARGKFWESTCSNWNEFRLCHEIVNVGRMMGVEELCRKMKVGENDTGRIRLALIKTKQKES